MSEARYFFAAFFRRRVAFLRVAFLRVAFLRVAFFAVVFFAAFLRVAFLRRTVFLGAAFLAALRRVVFLAAIVRFERRPSPPVEVPSPGALFTLARAGFAQRRKTLRQALKSHLGTRVEEVLAAAGIAPMTRAETLTLDEWAALARAAAPSSEESGT